MSGLEQAYVCSVDGANVGHNARICPDDKPAEGALTLRKLDFPVTVPCWGTLLYCPLPRKRGLEGGIFQNMGPLLRPVHLKSLKSFYFLRK